MCAIAMIGMMFTSCEPKPDPTPIDPGKNLTSGLYLFGPATGIETLDNSDAAVLGMAAGINEVDGQTREGMYEKYIVLEANKDFQFAWKQGNEMTYYGGTLAAQKLTTDNAEIDGYFGALAQNAKMQVPQTGFYHVILDFCKTSELPGGPQIIVVPVVFGVRGAMNSWGYTEAEAPQVVAGQKEITWQWKDQEMSTGGEFKFAHSNCWKINLDSAELVKANSNLGGTLNGEEVSDLVPNGANIKVEKAGLYEITLTYNLAKGDMKNSFKATVKLTQESSLPTEMYMIGAAWGNWSWGSEGIVSLIPVHSHPGMFWCTRFFKANEGFKFSSINVEGDWSKAFGALGTNTGFTNDGDGNAVVAENGLYTVIVDYKNNALTVKKAAIYGMGDCFSNVDDEKWVEGKHAFTIDENGIASFTLVADGNLRMYSDVDNAGNWWQSEFNIYDGKIVYRADGGDQEAVPAKAGDVIALDFNAGTVAGAAPTH